MRFLFRALFTTAAIAWPLTALAAPGPVMGLGAEVINGQIHIRWEAPEESDDIAHYRIYYSTKSILDNDGEYDDFEITSEQNREYILTDYPESDPLYIGVLAVDSEGEESPTFTEEVRVYPSEDGPGKVLRADGSPAPEVMEMTDAPLTLVKAEAVSNTGVLVTFSEAVGVSRSEAVGAFSVRDSSGIELPLRRLVLQGTNILLHTSVQKPGAHYTLLVSPAVRASADPQSMLREDGRAISFMAFGSTGAASSMGRSAPPTDTSARLADVEHLQMKAEREPNGLYTITVSWEAPAGANSFILRQSQDGARTFTNPQTAPGMTRSVRIRGVTPGSFGIHVTVVGETGTKSSGRIATLTLADRKARSSRLTGSGMGTLAVMIGAGAFTGLRRIRRKREVL